MCGRVYVKSSLAGLMQAFAFADPGDAEGMANEFPRWNGRSRLSGSTTLSVGAPSRVFRSHSATQVLPGDMKDG